jgi:hypothetical protein
MTKEQAIQRKKELNAIVDGLSKKLNEPEKNGLGLIIEEIRLSDEYRELQKQFDKAFKELQQFNKWYVKEFRKKR